MLNAQDSASRKEQSLQAAHKKMVRQLLSNKTGKSALASANKLSQYKTAASFLVRLFINPKLMFCYGLRREGLNLNTLEDNESNKENMDGTGGNPGDDEDEEEESIVDAIFAKTIHETAGIARGSDIKGFKSHIGKYILENPNTNVLDPPIVDNSSKSNRGFAHPQFAPFLVTFDHYPKYVKDPAGFCALILNKDASTDIKIDNSSGVPMLLHDMKLYNLEDREAGWGRSFLLVRCLKHFLNGPGSVFRDPESAKALGGVTVRRMYKIKQLTPQLIAHVACMIRFALCSASRFCNVDRQFSLRKFYEQIIFFLEDPDDWSKEVVDFLNDQVLLINDNEEQDGAEDGNATDPEVRIIRASHERRRKEKELAEKAAVDLAAAEKAAAGAAGN
ncbi:hypothetical protein BDP27DRAFT_1432815 [Rhodocollybia butyracea]|uniref:Uncharacterized protein n=1 Tax=Rhodocollybia butyracea TaxID=206335 RepID=A0A9P5P9W2_9AGAR|nr:hypothetical protein BDP27DRAFT_1432815 [Rhodocollybia butyracea]